MNTPKIFDNILALNYTIFNGVYNLILFHILVGVGILDDPQFLLLLIMDYIQTKN